MRFLLSFFIFTLTAFPADYVINGRLMGQFESIPGNRVDVFKQAITNQVDKADLLVTSVESNTITNGSVIYGWFDLQFKTGSTYSNKLATKWAQLTNYNWPNGVTGIISLHFCALDASNTNGYVPCGSTNAFYSQKLIP